MKQRIKILLLTLLTLGILAIATGCGDEENPYQTNDSEGYTVSVKYDANGGTFTTNTSIIVDSFNISGMKENSSGEVEIALISPDSEARENDAFTAVRNGYFLAGWYEERMEIGKDEDGNPIYSYGKKWDFEHATLKVNPDETHTSSEPEMTLYAAWIPLFEIEFYDNETKELLAGITYDPSISDHIEIPAWDEETGTIDMKDFPEKEGYTFDGVYLDGIEVTESVVAHSGNVDYENGTANNPTMKLYVEWVEGEWYHIYNAEQFVENASINGCYEIYADLDFAEEIWPTSLMYGNFNGTIHGNGHTFKNIEAVQTNNKKVSAGLFGKLTEAAEIMDVTFENVTVTLEKGTLAEGTSYGLFAGVISDGSEISNVTIVGSTLQIDSKCYFGVADYSIGLLCGDGDASVVEHAEIDCVATGDNPDAVKITLEDNKVTVEIDTQ